MEKKSRCSAFDMPVRQTLCGGVGVTRFGSTFVYDGAPDLMEDVSFQVGNGNPRVKVMPKESKDLEFNYVGAATTRMPVSYDRAELPQEPVHLIDGDIETTWISHGQTRSDNQPVWVRIDLAAERKICKIVFRKRPKSDPEVRNPWTVTPYGTACEAGRAFPGRMRIDVSRDAYHWMTLFEGKTGDEPTKETFEVSLESPVTLKQLKVSGTDLVLAETHLYAMSFAEIELLDENGDNQALVSKGAGVQVSSAYHGDGVTPQEQRCYWPLHWKSGFKWARIGYHDDPINWHRVERSRGVYDVDPMADAAIDELAANKVNIVMCLNFGNRLYSGPHEWVFRGYPEFDSCRPKPPTTEEALAAWEKYVEFMVAKYKDKVYCFEIWNEPHNFYWGNPPNVSDYVRLVRRTLPIIRRLAPGKPIKLGAVGVHTGPEDGVAKWTDEDWAARTPGDVRYEAVKELGEEMDLLGIHPTYNPPDDYFTTYLADLARYREHASRHGFKGGMQVCEWSVASLYPSPDPALPQSENWAGCHPHTEIAKAKKCLEMICLNSSMDIPSMYCEMYHSFYTLCELSLFRTGEQADPIMPMQPLAAFYAMRNLATMMDGLHSTVDFTPVLSGAGRYPYAFPFKSKSDRAVVAWWGSDTLRKECYEFRRCRLVLPFKVEGEITLLEPLNGVAQKLEYGIEGSETVIDNLNMGDSPVVIRFR